MNRGLSCLAAHGLLALLSAGACARPEAPPGGPEDLFPPYVIETTPDTFAVVEPGVNEVHFRFSERISERPATGNLNDAVVVSPSTGLVRVRHQRDGITVEMQEGFEAGRLYRVTVLPVISDMFQNRLRDPFDLVVSTGDEFVPNVLAGMVEDRVTGDAVPDVRVEARFQVGGDTVTHWNLTDQDGVFSLRYVPDGPFEVRAWMDRNRDREVGESEPQTRFVPGRLDLTPDTSFTVLSLIEPDTTPARLASVTVEDSVTLRFEFDDYLDPEIPGALIAASLVVADMTDSTEMEPEADSLEATEPAETPPPVPPGDTVQAGDTVPPGDAVQAGDTVPPGDAPGDVEAADSAAAAEVVDTLPLPEPGDTVRVRILTEREYEALLAERADSAARAVADSVAQAAADAAVEPGAAGAAAGDPEAAAPEETSDETEAEPGRVTLSGLPLPDQTLVGVLFEPLRAGIPYEASISRVMNIAGTGRGQGTTVVVLELPPEEPEELEDMGEPADTIEITDPAAAVDTGVVVPDTGQVADSLQSPDTVPVPDTVTVPDTVPVRGWTRSAAPAGLPASQPWLRSRGRPALRPRRRPLLRPTHRPRRRRERP